jgi:transcription termination factor NusB
MSKESARQQILELVEKFSSQSERFESADYNETQTRLDFINPFFTALDWDIDNKQELSQSIREVVNESLSLQNLQQIENKILYCEDKINEIIYQLYGLTENEIKIIEGK